MEEHPIPQNVTGFQFKLIGNMTVKQFGYVATGVIMAAIIYYLPLKGALSIFFKAILIPLFGSAGALIAFMPIDGRPVDVMIGNFIQALFSPNQYVYRKSVKIFSFSTISLSRPRPVLQKGQKSHNTPKQDLIDEKGLELQKLLAKSSTGRIKNDLDAREQAYLNALSTPAAAIAPSTTPVLPASPRGEPNPPVAPTPSELSNKEEALKKQLELAKQEETSPHDPQDLIKTHQKVLDLEKQIQETNAQKQLLEDEIVALKNQLLPKPQAAPKTPSTHVRSMPSEMNKNMGILVSDTPNVITGMVKDARGNVLPNILVEIKDKKGNPVRAFKTNSLGNFASATPLSAGTYTIMLEDLKKQHTFDTIQITTNDQIVSPIEITSYDKREELRKELFS